MCAHRQSDVTFLLSAGNDYDSTDEILLIEQVNISGSCILADRAYGTTAIQTYILGQEASYVIPPKSNILDPWPVNWDLYKERRLLFPRKKLGNKEKLY